MGKIDVDTIDPRDVYKRIKYLLSLKDSSLYHLADALGIARTSTTNWNRYFPQLTAFYKICDFLGCSMEYLLTGDVNNNGINSSKLMSDFEKLSYENQLSIAKIISSLAEKNCSQ